MKEPVNHLNAIRKRDLLEFTPRPADVCRIEDGSTNLYLKDPRAIEEFLKTIEPRYNQALEKIRTDKVDKDAIYVISGLAAYFMACSPGAARFSIPLLRTTVESFGKFMDKRGMFPPPPPELGGATFTELLEAGKIKFEIDEKFPQSMGIDGIRDHLRRMGNFHWEILENDLSNSPFLTSDYPVSLQETEDARVLDRVFPLSPDLAIRFCANPHVRNLKDEKFEFPNFSMRRLKCSEKRVHKVNARVVKCAESLVFSNIKAGWLKPFVERRRDFQIEGVTTEVAGERGSLLVARQRVSRDD